MTKSTSRLPKSSKTPVFFYIFDLPDHPDGVHKSWKPFLSTPLVPTIPKRYHMLGYNDKIHIKISKIFQNPSFWTFFTFLIILMVFINPGNNF